MSKQKGSAVVAVLLVVIVLLGLGLVLYAGSHQQPTTTTVTEQPAGNVSQTLAGEISCLNGICTWNKAFSCNAASSTGAVVVNPFGASSTASIMLFTKANATTTSLVVGTTTRSRTYGLSSSDVSPTLVNVTIASNTPETLRSGVTVGFPTAGAGTFLEIGVGANENIGIFSTSSVSGVGSAGYVNLGCFGVATFRAKQLQ